MARIPLSNDTIREMINHAAQRANVSVSSVEIEYVLFHQLVVTLTITCELGSQMVAVSGMYFHDNKDELQSALDQSMLQWILPNAN